MNEDFSEIIGQFQNILKDKNINLNNIVGEEKSSPTDNYENSDFSFDIDTIMKIKDIISKMNKNSNCPRNKLLNSLKPYLEDSKKEKLNQYIKIANLLSILETTDLGINIFNEKEKGYDFILIITLFLLIF